MPIVTIQMSPQTTEMKEEMIRAVTESLSSVTRIPTDAFRVIIHDVPAENIGIGGKTLSKIREEAQK